MRLISATNRNLDKEVRKGGFREDLFFQMNVITLKKRRYGSEEKIFLSKAATR